MAPQLSSNQQEKVTNFKSVTNADKKKAIVYLEKYKWNIELAIDEYYKDGINVPKKPKAIDPKPIQAIFDKYKDTDAIRDEGFFKFMTDCGMADMEDVVSLIFAWQCDCKTFGEFTLAELEQGFKKLKYDSVAAICANTKTIRDTIKQESKFKELYEWVFNYVRDPNKRYIERDAAVALWQVLLKNRFDLLEKWCNWITIHFTLGITKDSWLMIRDFADQKVTVETYNPEESWPSIIDNFIEFLKTQ